MPTDTMLRRRTQNALTLTQIVRSAVRVRQ
jgi:hypothetical protein